MTTLNEGQHPGEFLVWEANASYTRETRTVSSGQNLVDGQLVQLSGEELVAKAATLDTDGNFTTAIEGILIGAKDASATGANADIPDSLYLKRGPALVKLDLITFPAGSPARAKAITDLLAMDIKCLESPVNL